MPPAPVTGGRVDPIGESPASPEGVRYYRLLVSSLLLLTCAIKLLLFALR